MRMLCVFFIMVNVVYFLWQIRNQENLIDFPLDVTTPSLVLLGEFSSEGGFKSLDSAKTDQAGEVKAVETSPNSRNCIVLEGFLDQSAAEQVVRFLSERGIASKLNVLETQRAGNYLVYLPPFQSRENALKKLNELQAKGIDSFIIADGDRINGISLGVFVKEESAIKLQTQLKDKGYNPSIVSSSQAVRQYSLRITGHSAPTLTESLIEEISQKYVRGKVIQTKQSCAE